MDKTSEVLRTRFYVERDGIESAKDKVVELYDVYRKAARSLKLKYGSHPYRKTYIESAVSFRHIRRNFDVFFRIY